MVRSHRYSAVKAVRGEVSPIRGQASAREGDERGLGGFPSVNPCRKDLTTPEWSKWSS